MVPCWKCWHWRWERWSKKRLQGVLLLLDTSITLTVQLTHSLSLSVEVSQKQKRKCWQKYCQTSKFLRQFDSEHVTQRGCQKRKSGRNLCCAARNVCNMHVISGYWGKIIENQQSFLIQDFFSWGSCIRCTPTYLLW